MKFNEIISEFEKSQYKIRLKEQKGALKVLKAYARHVDKYDIRESYDKLNALLKLCFDLNGTKKGEILEALLEKKGFNLSPSIHNAIYHLLGNEIDYLDSRIEPEKFVGVDSVIRNGKKNIVFTKLGKIEVYNATEIFRNDIMNYIFELPLPHMCYARTYDFVQKCPNDSKAVIMKMPNFFYDGHYHVYVERANDVIDIAANAYYDSLEEASKVLNGEVVGKYTYYEIELFCRQFGNNLFEDRSKIYVMTACKTIKNRRC